MRYDNFISFHKWLSNNLILNTIYHKLQLKIHWDIYSKNDACLEFYGITKDPETKERGRKFHNEKASKVEVSFSHDIEMSYLFNLIIYFSHSPI